MSAPAYPGYRAPECNGCGLCCLTVPCVIAVKLNLWRDGAGCRALEHEAGRYWCGMVRNPRRYSVRASKLPRRVWRELAGAGNGCDFRAAWSLSDAVRSLTGESIAGGASWPRPCVYYHVDGSAWYLELAAPDAEPTIQRIRFDREPDPPIALHAWSPP